MEAATCRYSLNRFSVKSSQNLHLKPVILDGGHECESNSPTEINFHRGTTHLHFTPAQNRRVDEIYLRLQKSAPFPTRKWLHVLCVSFLPNAAWPNRAYTDKQTFLWSEINPSYFKNQPKSHRNFHPGRICLRRITTFLK
jgi:hypothetical protein